MVTFFFLKKTTKLLSLTGASAIFSVIQITLKMADASAERVCQTLECRVFL